MLDLELDGPLYKASEQELQELCAHLDSTQYLEREKRIEKLVDEAYNRWLDSRNNLVANNTFTSSTSIPPLYVANMNSTQTGYVSTSPPPTQAIAITTHTQRLTISLPTWIPMEYAKAILERMIREQMEEA